MRARREALRPEEAGLPPRPAAGRRGPRVRGLSQTDVDFLMRKGVGTYQKVESGALRPTPAYLLELARVLRFKDSEYIYAHLEYFGTEPSLPLHPAAEPDLLPSWQQVLDGQREMAYITDFRYNLRFHNEPFAQMFPRGEPPENTMAWMLLDREAREFTLMDWGSVWLPALVPALRASLAAHPDDPVLLGIREGLMDDPWTRRHYQESGSAKIHPDGDRRPLRHAILGEGHVTMMLSQFPNPSGARYTTLLFDRAETVN
ncbi:helix-turn-helix domain-containing protein [Streptomyces sp. YS-3]|uniref:MmyB family transcriptional regulator n=1 Tax=Streptomyces sp. YS-3 TaxID=3381352 RepID=UPI0038622829